MHTYACRWNNIRLLVDKWLNLPDRPVSDGNKREGGSRDGREGMREEERQVDIMEGKMAERREAVRVKRRGIGEGRKSHSDT